MGRRLMFHSQAEDTGKWFCFCFESYLFDLYHAHCFRALTNSVYKLVDCFVE
jgi:hypothetical protein